MILIDFNHEVWRICIHCGSEFDWRNALWNQCPDCGKKWNE
ncbi:hypothetical protein [Chryseobacterium mulctrae]|nr:hypothetical protein [Chryseobacterium mulctrae]